MGAKINRIYVVGVLTDIEKLERNGNTHYRARVSDRTGVFYIYAGQYDPQVIKVLSALEPPAYIAVIGKSRLYSPSEGVTYVSIRPESITVVDKTVRDYWLLDACKSMKLRLEAVVEAQQMTPPEPEKLVKLGFDPAIAQGVMEALNHYDQPDLEQYKNMLVEVLKYLVVDNGEGHISIEKPVENNLKDLTAEFKTAEELADEEPIEDVESAEELEFEEEDSKIMAAAVKNKIDKNAVEDIVNSLLDCGKVYEPMLGRIKRMD
jgi:RPA family protein